MEKILKAWKLEELFQIPYKNLNRYPKLFKALKKKNRFYLIHKIPEKKLIKKIENLKGIPLEILSKEEEKSAYLLLNRKILKVNKEKILIQIKKDYFLEGLKEKGVLWEEEINSWEDQRYIRIKIKEKDIEEGNLPEKEKYFEILKKREEILKELEKERQLKFSFVPEKNLKLENEFNQFIEKLRDILVSFGFKEFRTSFIEDITSFDLLKISKKHPLRSKKNTFFLNSEKILRPHTTAASIKTIQETKEEQEKIFSIQKVFRRENRDATHLEEFHQIEGIILDKNANIFQLINFSKAFLKSLGYENIRIRRGYFPYTQPSLEIDVFHKNKEKYFEILGGGIFRKKILDTKNPAIGFGIGVERLFLLKKNKNSLKDLYA